MNRNNLNGTGGRRPLKPMLGGLIINRVIRLQQYCALKMQNSVQRFSQRTQKIMFATLFIIAASFNCYTTLEGLNGGPLRLLNIQSIRLPITENDNLGDGKVISGPEFNQIKAFTWYMDSLRKSSAGTLVADSITMQRPGLMDSIQVLNRLYLSQESTFRKK